MTFDDAVVRLRAGLAAPLPGAPAQEALAPRPRRAWPPRFDIARIRDAAGLLIVFPLDHRPAIVLTVRAGTLGRHGGQVSLPGGVVDPGETFEQAALREANEEIALPHGEVEVLGALTALDIPVSGFRLHPIVARAARRPPLAAADGEVDRILEIPVAELFDPARFSVEERTRDGRTLTIPFFRLRGVEIWGATAMVLAEFLTLLGWVSPEKQ